MSDSVYQLVPFGGQKRLPNLHVKAVVSRTEQQIAINFVLDASIGELKQIKWPATEIAHVRRNELWKTTCFEAFVGSRDSHDYFEYNLAPSGDWNVYHFDSYRQGMKIVLPHVQTSPIRSHANSECRHEISFALEFEKLQINGPLALGLTAVVEFQDGHKEYWAISHKSEKPDFHLRSTWELA